MLKTTRTHRTLLILFLSLFITSQISHAQSDVTATIQFSNGETVTTSDFSEPIGIQPNELISITIQFGTVLVGQPVVVEPIDGGAVSIGSSVAVIGTDGRLNFDFLPPPSLGTKSIGIRTGSTMSTLKFSVANAARP